MRAVFAILFLLSVILFFWGIISPTSLARIIRLKRPLARKYSSLGFGFLALLFVILIGSTVSKTVMTPVNLRSKNSDSQTSYGHSNVTIKQVTQAQTISYSTVDQTDNSMASGTAKIEQYGQNGVETVTYNLIYTNGQQTNKTLVSSSVTTAPTKEIVDIGPSIAKTKSTQKHSSKSCTTLTRNSKCF
jgi:hypothetical protein